MQKAQQGMTINIKKDFQICHILTFFGGMSFIAFLSPFEHQNFFSLPQSKPWLLATLWPSTSWRVGACFLCMLLWPRNLTMHELFKMITKAIHKMKKTWASKYSDYFMNEDLFVILRLISHYLKQHFIAERLRTPASPMGVSINKRPFWKFSKKKGNDCICSKWALFNCWKKQLNVWISFQFKCGQFEQDFISYSLS